MSEVTAAQRRHHFAVGVSPRERIQHHHLAAQRWHRNYVAAARLEIEFRLRFRGLTPTAKRFRRCAAG